MTAKQNNCSRRFLICSRC